MGIVKFMSDPNATDLVGAESDRQTKDLRFDPIWRAEADAKATWRNRPERHDDRPDVGSGVDRKVWIWVGGRWYGHWELMPAEEVAEMSQFDIERMMD
jgi:hypothetical protein